MYYVNRYTWIFKKISRIHKYLPCEVQCTVTVTVRLDYWKRWPVYKLMELVYKLYMALHQFTGQLSPMLQGTVENTAMRVRPIQSPPSTPLDNFIIHRCGRTADRTRLRTNLAQFESKVTATRRGPHPISRWLPRWTTCC